MITVSNPIDSTHYCTLTTPNYMAVLVYKTKQHSKQHIGLKYVICIEMTD